MEYTLALGTYPSSNGINQVSYRIYRPVGVSPRGVVQISHGMCEYIARYEEFIAFLCDNGWAVVGNDHIGHGDSVKSADELGYFAPQNGWDCLVEDVYILTAMMQKEFPHLPYYLLGHSMGSFIAREYLTRYGRELTGAVISGTSGPNPSAGVAIGLANMVARLKGEKYRSGMINHLAFGSYNRYIEPKRTPNDWLTRDEAIVDRYNADPLCTFVFTASGFKDLFTILSRVSSADWAKKLPPELPLLFISGEMDPVGQYGKGVEKVLEAVKMAGIRDVASIIYPQGRHEMLNEINRREVYHDVLDFLEKHIRK